jgi:hypothetical protein
MTRVKDEADECPFPPKKKMHEKKKLSNLEHHCGTGTFDCLSGI